MPPPKFILGNIALETVLSQEETVQFIQLLKELGVRQADSSPTWPLQQPGALEPIIGLLLQFMPSGYQVDSRVECKGNGDGTMAPEAISASLEHTLKDVGLKEVNVYYCNRPDYQTPIVEQAAAIDKEYRAGKFNAFGVCNFPVPLLEKWLEVCEEHGYVKPTVFQGQYNLLCRSYEETHFPLLRKHKIRFFAHSPMAGGFLSGKVTLASDRSELKDTRWEPTPSNPFGNAYIGCYDKPSMHEAVRTMDKLCNAHDISMLDAATRWIFYHSKLIGGPIFAPDRGDAVIMGSHTLPMLMKYADAYIAGPLPEELVRGLDGLWEGVKADSDPVLQW